MASLAAVLEVDVDVRGMPEVEEAFGRLRAYAGTLERFKAYVHKRLDEAGVPADPEPEANAKHGCRIEGRLNWVLGQIEQGWGSEEAAYAKGDEDARRAFEYALDAGQFVAHDQEIRAAAFEEAATVILAKQLRRWTARHHRGLAEAVRALKVPRG